jgi:cyclopropane fatty-acyl-phospholipid synthase-like methyltransferase
MVLPFSDACERNKDPILGVLRGCLAERRHVLEIGSGTGQHAVYFAAQLPHLTWHPTEQLANLEGLSLRIRAEGPPNVDTPTLLDVRQAVWPVRSVDVVFTANTLHIMSWAQVEALFDGIGTVLTPGGIVCIYGPFCYGGRYTSPSNQEFDGMLRARDPNSGLREIEAVKQLAADIGLNFMSDHDLPAFNRLLIFSSGS